MDKKEAKAFLSEVKKIVVPERAENYKEEDFDKLFKKFDDDKDGFMDKTEMSVFLKQVFKKS
jgi:Ca2+-binding EF-hand superfamily protein